MCVTCQVVNDCYNSLSVTMEETNFMWDFVCLVTSWPQVKVGKLSRKFRSITFSLAPFYHDRLQERLHYCKWIHNLLIPFFLHPVNKSPRYLTSARVRDSSPTQREFSTFFRFRTSVSEELTLISATSHSVLLNHPAAQHHLQIKPGMWSWCFHIGHPPLHDWAVNNLPMTLDTSLTLCHEYQHSCSGFTRLHPSILPLHPYREQGPPLSPGPQNTCGSDSQIPTTLFVNLQDWRFDPLFHDPDKSQAAPPESKVLSLQHLRINFLRQSEQIDPTGAETLSPSVCVFKIKVSFNTFKTKPWTFAFSF